MGYPGAPMSRVLSILFLALQAGCRSKAVSSDPPDAAPAPAPLLWYERADLACAAARAQNKPVLVLFYASWDVFSSTVQRKTLVDPRIRPALDRLILLRVDRTDSFMADRDPPTAADLAEARWHANSGKYGTVLILAADCTTERGRAGPDDPIDTQLSVESMAKLLSQANP